MRRERDPNNHKAWLLYLTPRGKIFLNVLDQESMPQIKKTLEEVKALGQDDENLG